MPAVLTPMRIAGIAAAAVVLVGAVAAASARSDAGPSYRTATASRQTVDQVLHAVATVEPVSQATVAFPVAGTVAAVDVEVGDAVTVGSRLAKLDVADLKVAVDQEQAALDQAELTLSLALAGEDVGSVSGGANPGGSTFGRPTAGGADTELRAAQQAVLDAQRAVDEATAASQQAYDSAVAVCSPAAVDATTTTSEVASGEDSAACLAALQAVLDAQAAVTAAQADLTDAADALTALLEQRAAEQPAGTTTTTTPSGPSTPSIPGGSLPNGSGSNGQGGTVPSGSSSRTGASPTGGSGTTSSPSAEDLIAYQKQVDAAADQLAVAQQAVDQATIVSPLDGTVASVALAVGDEVEGGSTTANIVVVGTGGFEVTTSVSVKDLPGIEVGQATTVTPDGADTAVAGEVVRIGVTPDASSSTSTYPVTIALTGDTSAMGNGSTASVSIVTAAADRALAVPTSAVAVDGDRATVQAVVDGTAKPTTVEIGAVGQTWTEITKGLEKGDVVVLADLDEPLPGSATDSSSASSGNRQFPGGVVINGGPPSGFTPGGARPGG